VTVDAEMYKAGMRRLAASVAVLTVGLPDGRRHGMTATAVCSVSAAPPILLCCINRNSAARAAFSEANNFAVNVLAASDRALADRFARPMDAEERFAEGLWARDRTGAPVLETAIATFDCERSHSIEVGGHTVFFGEVQAVRVRSEHIMPLLYAHGGYGEFAAARPVPLPDLMWVPDWRTEV